MCKNVFNFVIAPFSSSEEEQFSQRGIFFWNSNWSAGICVELVDECFSAFLGLVVVVVILEVTLKIIYVIHSVNIGAPCRKAFA